MRDLFRELLFLVGLIDALLLYMVYWLLHVYLGFQYVAQPRL